MAVAGAQGRLRTGRHERLPQHRLRRAGQAAGRGPHRRVHHRQPNRVQGQRRAAAGAGRVRAGGDGLVPRRGTARRRLRRRLTGPVLRPRNGWTGERHRLRVRVLRRVDERGQRSRGDQGPVPEHPPGHGTVAAGGHGGVHPGRAGGCGRGACSAAPRRPCPRIHRGRGRDARAGGGAGGAGRAGRVLVGRQCRHPRRGPVPAGDEPRPPADPAFRSVEPVQHSGVGDHR